MPHAGGRPGVGELSSRPLLLLPSRSPQPPPHRHATPVALQPLSSLDFHACSRVGRGERKAKRRRCVRSCSAPALAACITVAALYRPAPAHQVECRSSAMLCRVILQGNAAAAAVLLAQAQAISRLQGGPLCGTSSAKQCWAGCRSGSAAALLLRQHCAAVALLISVSTAQPEQR